MILKGFHSYLAKTRKGEQFCPKHMQLPIGVSIFVQSPKKNSIIFTICKCPNKGYSISKRGGGVTLTFCFFGGVVPTIEK